MRPVGKTMAILGMLGVGYVLGSSGVLTLRSLSAQAETAPSVEASKRLTEAFAALKAAGEALEQESLYMPATTSMNVFAITAGGLNAMTDLEEGRGVDPETFAALYAGEAKPEVKENLDTDDQGRLTYKGKLIRIYPKHRMKKIYQERLKYSGATTTKK